MSAAHSFANVSRRLHTVLAIANDVHDEEYGDKLHSGFPHSVRMLVLSSLEGAFYVGALPSILARNEEILYEPAESCRASILVFANCLVLELLELFSYVGEHGGVAEAIAASEGPGVTPVVPASGTSEAAPQECSTPRPAPKPRGAGSSGKRAGGQASAPAAAAAAADADAADNASAPPQAASSTSTSLLKLYLDYEDATHLSILGMQSILVCTLLADFLYTIHWRSHACSLVSNYALLYVCVLFRQSRGTSSADAKAD